MSAVQGYQNMILNKKSRRLVVKIALFYITVALLWNSGSTWLLKEWGRTSEHVLFWDFLKDSIFGVITMMGIVWMMRNGLFRIQQEQEEKLRAEEARKESFVIYQQMFAVEKDGMFLVNNETGDFLEVNPAAEQLYGYSRAEFLKMKAVQISAEPKKTMKAIRQGNINIPVRLHRRKDGTVFPVEITGSYFDLNGRKLHVAAIRDISERLRSEAVLKESEERYRNLFEHMNAGAALCRMIYDNGRPVDYSHVAINRHAEEMGNLHNVGGQRASEIMPAFLKEDREVFEMFCRVCETGVTESGEYWLNSIQKWIQLSVYRPIDGHFVTLFSDVTEQHQNKLEIERKNALLKSLFDSIPDLIFYKDLNGVYQGGNPAFSRFTQRNADELIGKTDHELFGRDVAKRFQADDRKMLESLQPIHFEEWVTYPDGKRVLLDTLKTPYRGPNGELLGVLGVSRDITLRKQTEISLSHSNSLLLATLESTADGILVVDRFGKVASFNQKFLQLWNIPNELTVDREDHRLLDFVIAQLAAPEQFIAKVEELYHNPSLVSFDELHFRDGRVFERYSQSQSIGGEIIGRVWSFRDVTARRQAEIQVSKSEMKLRNMLEVSPLPMALNDDKYIINYLTPLSPKRSDIR